LISASTSKMSDHGEGTAPRAAPADFDGPTQNRSCTDIIGTLLIVCMWISMTIIGGYAIKNGNHEIILNPMDYDGNICGTIFNGTDMTEFPKLVYVNNFLGGVCVKECPSLENLTDVRTLLTYDGVYQNEDDENVTLPLNYVEVANYSESDNVKTCDAEKCNTDPKESYTSQGINKGNGYAEYAMDTYEVHHRCLSNPKAIEEVKKQIEIPDELFLNVEEIDQANEFIAHVYGDIFTAKYYILLLGFFLSLVLSFFYAQLLRVPCLVNIMVWVSIFCTICIIFGTGIYMSRTAKEWKDADPPEYNDSVILATDIISYVLYGIGAIAVFLVIFLREAIMLAIVCVKQAARAIAAMPLIILLPLVQAVGLLGYMAVWLVYAVNLASLGDVVSLSLPTDSVITVRSYEFDDNLTRLGWYLLFCLFWSIAFMQAVSQIIIAMSVSKWYFCRDKNSIGSSTFVTSISTSIYYHTGTAAIGSLIIAIIRLIRTIVTKLQKKAKQMDNKCGEALLCCCQCCLWCFEKFMKFLNKKAYIQTAIFGTSFCSSAKEAFFLILRNARRVAGISYVTSVLIFTGRIFIASFTSGIAYIVIDRIFGPELYSPISPVIVVFILAYNIGDMFLEIFEMSTETILQCFIADEEMFEGNSGYADGELRDWFDNNEEETKKVLDAKG